MEDPEGCCCALNVETLKVGVVGLKGHAQGCAARARTRPHVEQGAVVLAMSQNGHGARRGDPSLPHPVGNPPLPY